MTRNPVLSLAIKRECLLSKAQSLRDARDMEGAAKAEAELRAVNREILMRGKK